METHHRAALVRAISPDRLRAFRLESARSGRDELRLYLWDRDLSAAAIADIAILEVALRNAMNDALTRSSGRPDWYRQAMGLDNRSLQAVARAWNDVPESRRTPGRVVAQLMFGFWRNLLEAGGDVGFGPLKRSVDYEDLWRASLHSAFRGGRAVALAEHGQFTRAWTLDTVKEVQAIRNRAAHHEPLLNGIPIPGANRRITIQEGLARCFKLARLLDRDLETWLRSNSSLAAALAMEPGDDL
ncbi:hypothetical protein B7R21_01335 [Subtercola boreus]|uniref:CAAX protease n=1 Tax=Subtercola boreus TaxID=120213 RepID=A0A3E0W3L3_9MICO|nr:hypothetical protein [Subtercola boreus]RFA16786.1 hypothetical protein B7R21_01335 [Subtercola boreus]